MPSMRELAARFGTPLYVYDLSLVRERARALKAAISYAPFQPFYAIKANPCPAVARAILAEGYGIDAVSPGEVALALKLGVDPRLVLYTENNMTDAEMRQALSLGVTITCNSIDRLARLAESGARSCAVRFNPDIGAGAHEKICTAGPATKFGIHHAHVDEVAAISARSGLEVVGVHMHIGSGILDQHVHVQAMERLLALAIRLPRLSWIDIGGGFGVPYRASERPLELRALGRAVSGLMSAFAGRYQAATGRGALELRAEPGKFLVAQAGTLLTTVSAIKHNPATHADGIEVPGRVFVGCDTGFNHLVRPAMYDAYHRIDNLDGPDRPPEHVDIVGNICESGDVFARDYPLPRAEVGDLLAIRDGGAYGMSMASTYNLRPLPAEVAIDGEQVLMARERQTVEDLLSAWRW